MLRKVSKDTVQTLLFWKNWTGILVEDIFGNLLNKQWL